MKKLSLDLDGLRVDSFATAGEPAARGTVQGASIIEPTGWTYCLQCGPNTLAGCGPMQTQEGPTCGIKCTTVVTE